MLPAIFISPRNKVRKINANGIITTFAGGGTHHGGNQNGDGGQATSATIQHIYGITTDLQGNLYIAEQNNGYRVRKVDSNGIITTFAGGDNHNGASSGDGGQATNAYLQQLKGIGADAAGNIYIAEENKVRKVDANGIITTFAGGGPHLEETKSVMAVRQRTLIYIN